MICILPIGSRTKLLKLQQVRSRASIAEHTRSLIQNRAGCTE